MVNVVGLNTTLIAADRALNMRGRALTSGEIKILRSVYGDTIAYNKVLIYNRAFKPGMRISAPNGNIYYPAASYRKDFSVLDLNTRSTLVHEGIHLYQYYFLGWRVMLRGPFDRNYEYRLLKGKAFSRYGLEGMGMIAQHYYILREGGTISDTSSNTDYSKYTVASYQHLLPLGGRAIAGSRV